MKHLRWFAALVAAVWLCAPTHRPVAAQQPTHLAYLRSDNLLVPLGVFNGREWQGHWPSGDEDDPAILELPLPESFDAIPASWLPPGITLPVEWRYQPLAGRLETLRLVRLRRNDTSSSLRTEIGLQSQLPVKPGSIANGYGDDFAGLAISGPGSLGRIVTAPESETRRLFDMLQPAIAAIEHNAVEQFARESAAYRSSPRLLLPKNGQTLRRKDFLTKRGERPISGRHYYHISGYAQYGDANACGASLTIEGMVSASTRGVPILDNLGGGMFSGFCGDAPEYTEYVGSVTVGDRTFWIQRITLEDGFTLSIGPFRPVARPR